MQKTDLFGGEVFAGSTAETFRMGVRVFVQSEPQSKDRYGKLVNDIAMPYIRVALNDVDRSGAVKSWEPVECTPYQ
jgi:hypothetical protein